MWKGWSRKKYGFEIRRDMWKGGKINWWNWADQRIDAPKNCFFHRLVNIEGTSGRSFDGSTNGFALKEEDSAYTLPILEKITVRFFSFFHNSVLTLRARYDKWKKINFHKSILAQGLQMKFPADNDMLKGCYGNRTSCLNKDLPSEVWLKPKERQSWRYLSRILRPAFHRMSEFS